MPIKGVRVNLRISRTGSHYHLLDCSTMGHGKVAGEQELERWWERASGHWSHREYEDTVRATQGKEGERVTLKFPFFFLPSNCSLILPG